MITPDSLLSSPFPETTSDTEFVCRFRVRIGDPGEHVLGPYSLKVAGKVLQSNRKTIRVISSDVADPEVSFDRADVAVGSEFSVVLVTKGKTIDGIKWRDNPLVKNGGVTTSMNMNIVEGKTSTAATYKVSLTALKAGVLEVSPSSFDGLPSAWKFGAIKLQIRK